jgi:hypothetical protein
MCLVKNFGTAGVPVWGSKPKPAEFIWLQKIAEPSPTAQTSNCLGVLIETDFSCQVTVGKAAELGCRFQASAYPVHVDQLFELRTALVKGWSRTPAYILPFMPRHAYSSIF